jgi:hypothetical protein
MQREDLWCRNAQREDVSDLLDSCAHVFLKRIMLPEKSIPGVKRGHDILVQGILECAHIFRGPTGAEGSAD